MQFFDNQGPYIKIIIAEKHTSLTPNNTIKYAVTQVFSFIKLLTQAVRGAFVLARVVFVKKNYVYIPFFSFCTGIIPQSRNLI